MELIEDNFDFYERDITYKNIKLRRTGENIFLVSLEECICKPSSCNDGDFCWDAKVRELRVASDSSYSLNYSFN